MSVHLQPRDLLVLGELGEYGLLDTATINARHWPTATTPRACQERMSILVDAGLMRKTSLVVAVGPAGGGGSLPAVYSLTAYGADYVERETGRRPQRIAHKDLKEVTLLHRLETVKARLAMDDACHATGLRSPLWILEQDSYENVVISDPLERRQVLFERFTRDDGSFITCRPDASSLLHIPRPSNSDSFVQLVAYWEIDRGTNSSQREKEKIDGYEALIDAGAHVEHWPTAKEASVRIFYVCPSKERIKTLAQHVRGRPAARFYRFATKADIIAPIVLTSPVWYDADGKSYTIWQRPA